MPRKTILLVEDNQDDELLALRALQKSGIDHRVIVARDGVEALEYLFAAGEAGSEHGHTPDLVLLDLKLPRLDGIQVLRQMRADTRTALLPVVLLTSSREAQDLFDGYRSGANSYIRKPVDFIAFSDIVRQLGTYWLTINESPMQ